MVIDRCNFSPSRFHVRTCERRPRNCPCERRGVSFSTPLVSGLFSRFYIRFERTPFFPVYAGHMHETATESVLTPLGPPSTPCSLYLFKRPDLPSSTVVRQTGFDVTIGQCAVSDRTLAWPVAVRQTLTTSSDSVLCLIAI